MRRAVIGWAFRMLWVGRARRRHRAPPVRDRLGLRGPLSSTVRSENRRSWRRQLNCSPASMGQMHSAVSIIANLPATRQRYLIFVLESVKRFFPKRKPRSAAG